MPNFRRASIQNLPGLSDATSPWAYPRDTLFNTFDMTTIPTPDFSFDSLVAGDVVTIVQTVRRWTMTLDVSANAGTREAIRLWNLTPTIINKDVVYAMLYLTTTFSNGTVEVAFWENRTPTSTSQRRVRVLINWEATTNGFRVQEINTNGTVAQEDIENVDMTVADIQIIEFLGDTFFNAVGAWARRTGIPLGTRGDQHGGQFIAPAVYQAFGIGLRQTVANADCSVRLFQPLLVKHDEV